MKYFDYDNDGIVDLSLANGPSEDLVETVRGRGGGVTL